MPAWPFLMLITLALTAWGWTRAAWVAPALAFAGYVGMRGIMWGLPASWHEVVSCTLWLLVAYFMMYNRAYAPGFFYALSGLCYPVFLLIGFPMEYMGLSLIFAECFAALALLSIGGGIYGVDYSPRSNRVRLLFGGAPTSVGMAARQTDAWGAARTYRAALISLDVPLHGNLT